MENAPASFIPPFCPRPNCRFHLDPAGWTWIHFGSYTRQCVPQRIQRFRCCHCGSTFSTQTFSTTYYLKRPDLLPEIFERLLACCGYRQITRALRCPHTTVMSQAARLGRHALLFLHKYGPKDSVKEPLVIDGFESFAHSQYHPLHLNLAVGADSHFVYAMTFTELRRKGSMTTAQKHQREALERLYGRPEPGALTTSIEQLVKLAAPEPRTLEIRSDEHPAYPRAFKRLEARGWTIGHRCTPSVQARTTGNPLFPVNLLDLLLRHNSANHKRETIAFSKRHQSVVERAALLMLWRNFTKPFSENHGGGTPAMRVNLRSSPLSVKKLLKDRLFPERVKLPELYDSYYRRLIPTARIRNPRLHQLKLAF